MATIAIHEGPPPETPQAPVAAPHMTPPPEECTEGPPGGWLTGTQPLVLL
jgi:hypothetical protein